MAKITLADVPTSSSFIDSDSTYVGSSTYTPEWCVVAHDTDGNGITTLIAKNKMMSYPMDAKEPTNPDSDKRDYGNNSYEYSNILQYLNSDGLAGEWYKAQHEYDQSPISTYVVSGGAYNDRDAFLAHFTDDFKSRMRSVEKMGVSRKVHLPACNELCNTVSNEGSYGITFDVGIQYGTYTIGSDLSSASANLTLFRGNHDVLAPSARCVVPSGSGVTKFQKIITNTYNRYPYEGTGAVYPVIFMDSSTPVEYNTTDKKYYASWDNAPTLTVNNIDAWQASAFDITFQVNDADADAVMVDIEIDSSSIHHAYATLNTNTTVSTSSVFNSLAYGEHTITITADDGEKQVVVEKKFRKANVAPNTLDTVSENRVFVDNNTTYNGNPIEWYVAAKDIDGEGVISLMMKDPISNHEYDAKEVYNPNTRISENGYNLYSQSNILQWMNSNGGANEWYENQHQYDSPPSYESEAGFLNGFSETLLHAMKSVEKFGIDKRVHLPSIVELINTTSYNYDNPLYNSDDVIVYPRFNQGTSAYKSLVTTNSADLMVRSGRDNGKYGNYDSYPYYGINGLNCTSNAWRVKYVSAYLTSSYVIPTIYLQGDSLPIRYDSETDKYYLDFSIETEYSDYGRHNRGFTVGLKINCSTNIGDTTVKVYADNDTTALATLTISGFNQFEDINIPTSALSSLSLGEHTLTLKTDTLGIPSSASITYTKTADSVPTILSNSIGNIVSTVNTTYQVYDDDGDSLDVVIKLDGTQIDSIQNVTQHTDLPLTLTTAQFNALGYGNHSIVIEATDGTNTSTETLPFVKNSVPSISLSTHDLGEVLQPVTIDVTFSSDDGDNVTIKAYIDNQEIS